MRRLNENSLLAKASRRKHKNRHEQLFSRCFDLIHWHRSAILLLPYRNRMDFILLFEAKYLCRFDTLICHALSAVMHKWIRFRLPHLRLTR